MTGLRNYDLANYCFQVMQSLVGKEGSQANSDVACGNVHIYGGESGELKFSPKLEGQGAIFFMMLYWCNT